ncbi:MAG: ribonuclease [Christensenellaceae bacterium]|nr:ribonuclease [Christensenellaceae bacterium]
MKTKKSIIGVIILIVAYVAANFLGLDIAPHFNLPVKDKKTAVVQSNDNQVNTNLDEEGSYTSKEGVALYIHTYNKLPSNFITKKEAEKLGWDNNINYVGDVAPGKSIGGDKFGNYEELLPKENGKKYFECDIDYNGKKRNEKRIVYSNDGYIYYTGDHYKSFELLYEGGKK